MSVAITSCTPGPVSPGDTITASGTTDNCDNTDHDVDMNGKHINHQWDCEGGNWTLSFAAPQCGSGNNVITITIQRGACFDDCSVAVNCP